MQMFGSSATAIFHSLCFVDFVKWKVESSKFEAEHGF